MNRRLYQYIRRSIRGLAPIVFLLVFGMTTVSAATAITPANGGTNISADKAANSNIGSGWTALGQITIQEQLVNDFAASQTNATLILTAPTNRQFKAGSCSAYYAGDDITSAYQSTTATTLTITFSTDNNANKLDRFIRSGCQMQAIDGSILPSANNILRTSTNPGTAIMAGITNDVTNFGSLSQVVGAPQNLVITLPGQTFVPISGNIGTPVDQYPEIEFMIPYITAVDQFLNIATSYNGTKTLSYTGPGGTTTYTNSASFTNGQSTTTLNTTLTQVATGVTITVTDGILSGIVSSSFSVLDIIPPTATVTYNPATLTSGNVISTLTGFSEEGVTITNNGGLANYTFTNNGSFTYTFVDAAGNTGATTATVTRIDKVKPTANITYNPATATSGNVISTLTGFSETGVTITNNGGLANYTFTNNGSFTYTFVDAAGNTGATTATVTRIDKVKPTATVNYNPTTATSGNVVATLGSFSEPGVTITNNGGSTNYTFTGNGSFTYTFVDAVGNTGSTTATVTRIDKTKPTATVTYNPATTTSGNVISTLTGFSETGVTITNNGGSTEYTFTGNGSFTYTFVDTAGNTGSTTATVTRIDITKPTATVTYNPTTATSGSVISTLTGFSKTGVTITNNGGSTEYTFTGNGSFTYYFVDTLGNTGSTIATVSRIDNVAPVLTELMSITTPTNDSTPYYRFHTSKAGTITYSGGCFSVITEASFGENEIFFNTLSDGTYSNCTIRVTDALSNPSDRLTVTAFTIDTTAPTANIIYDITGATNQNVTATITGFSESITALNATGRVFTTNGSFIFTFKDLADNTGSVTATVTWIDKVKPVVTVVGASYKSVFLNTTYICEGATWTDNVDGSGFIALPTSGSVDTAIMGIYPLEFLYTDSAGNTGLATRIVEVSNARLIIDIQGANPYYIEYGNEYTEYGALREDQIDGTGYVTGTGIVSAVDTGVLGTGYTVTYTHVNSSGESVSEIREVIVQDTTAPAITLNGSGTEYIEFGNTYTEQGAIRTDAYDGSGIVNDISGSVNAGVVGTYYLEYIKGDSSGNMGSETRTVIVQDTIAPTVVLSSTNRDPTNTDIQMTAQFSEPVTGFTLSDIYIANGTKTNFITVDSATYTFTIIPNPAHQGLEIVHIHEDVCEDFAGNGNAFSNYFSITYDTISPTAIVNYEPATATNGNVVATLTGFSETLSGLNATGYIFTGNGSFEFTFTDLAGNTGSTLATVTRIDTEAVTGIISYSITGLTNQDVTANISFNKTGVTITNNDGLDTYDFTVNGSFEFTFTDSAGNTGATTATVNRIDKILPSIELLTPSSGTTITSGTWFSRSGYDDVAISGYLLKVFTETGIEVSSRRLTTTGTMPLLSLYTQITNGNYLWTVTAIDTAGNSTTAPSQVYIVDKEPPSLINMTTVPPFPIYNTGIDQDITFYGDSDKFPVRVTLSIYDDGGTVIATTGEIEFTTSGMIVSTFPGSSLNDGTYYYYGTIRDQYYNLTGGYLGEVFVDTISPTATVYYTPASGAVTSGDVIATLVGFSEQGITITNNGGSTTYIFTGNGSFEFTFQDVAGNVGSTIATVDWIDATIPTASIEYNITGATNQNVIATLIGFNKTGITITNNEGLDAYTFTGNGSFTFEFIDDVGHIGSTTATVSRIDTETVMGIISYSIIGPTNQDVTATISFNKTGITIINNTGMDTYDFTGNGSFTFTFTDSFGNTGSETATVTGIDKILPLIELLTPSSGTIVNSGTWVSWSGSDNVAISGYVFQILSETGGEVSSRRLTTTGTMPLLSSYAEITNGSYLWTVTAIDTAGNTTTAPSQVFIIDKQPPTLTEIITDPLFPVYNTGINQDITFYSSSDVYPVWITLYVYDSSGTVLMMTGEIQYDTSGSLTTTFLGLGLNDGVYYYYGTVRDQYYNLTGAYLGEVFVDTISPTATIHYVPNPGTWISGNVIVTITGFNETITGLNTDSYIFTENGSFEFTFQDLAGNTGSTIATVYWMDTSLPILWEVTRVPTYTDTITPSYTFNSNKAGTISYSGDCTSDTLGAYPGNNLITFNELSEGLHDNCMIRVTDTAGNQSNRLAVSAFTIDSLAPTATIVYDPTTTTSGNVLATITGFSEPITGLNATGYLFVDNGSFEFLFQNLAGVNGSTVATVMRIDINEPTLTQITPVPSPTYITTPSYTFSSNEAGYISYSGDCSSVTTGAVSGNNTVIFTALGAGTYSNCMLRLTDAAGNTSERLTINTFTIATPPSGGGGGGGGGGTSIDYCPNGDLSPSLYDGTCDAPEISTGEIHPAAPSGDITNSPYSQELNDAYQRAHAIGITTMPTIQKSELMDGLVRRYAAKMMVTYDIYVLGHVPNTGLACEFTDIFNESEETKFYITLACQLGLMGLTSDGTPDTTFYPRNRVTRAQFGTILSRALYGDRYNNDDPSKRYQGHLQALKAAGIMTKIDQPNMIELRGRVMLMLMRADSSYLNTPGDGNTTGIVVPEISYTTSEQDFINTLDKSFQFIFGYTLGAEDIGVRYLQYFLKENGYFTESINGRNGNATITALFNRQKDKNIVQFSSDDGAGYLGPTSREIINPLLKTLLNK